MRTLIATEYNLPHPPLEASRNSQDTYLTKKVLQEIGITSCRYETTTVKRLPQVGASFGFPFFIKPSKSIRSEWARLISNQDALNRYIKDLKQHYNTSSNLFLLEEAIEGHEVDVDMVLYEGENQYAEVSANFPIYKPFALETGHLMPSILNENVKKDLIEYAYKVARACGYDRGVFHIE